MPGTIQMNTSLTWQTEDGVTENEELSESIVMAGSIVSSNVQTIGFSAHEAVEIPTDLAAGTARWAFLKNVDPTNYIEIGLVVSGTFYPLIRLYPGMGHPISLATNTFYAKAAVAPARLKVKIGEA